VQQPKETAKRVAPHFRFEAKLISFNRAIK